MEIENRIVETRENFKIMLFLMEHQLFCQGVSVHGFDFGFMLYLDMIETQV